MVATTDLQLVLRPHEAAKALAISTRTLWALTKRGEIPHVRLGHCLRYDVEQLREYLSQKQSNK
jgi:excisionase family DNA binding protein